MTRINTSEITSYDITKWKYGTGKETRYKVGTIDQLENLNLSGQVAINSCDGGHELYYGDSILLAAAIANAKSSGYWVADTWQGCN